MLTSLKELRDTNRPTPRLRNPQLVFPLATIGGLTGLIVTEKTIDPRPDAGRQRIRVTFNPSGLVGLATGTQGMHSLLTVRF